MDLELLRVNGKRARCWLILGLLVLLIAGDAAAEQQATQNEVQAAFIFNFLGLVEWPPGAFSDGDGAIVVGVLGDEELAEILKNIVMGKRAHDRPIIVKQVSDSYEGCQVLFVGESEAGRLDEILGQISGSGILTVSDIPSFATQGGMIGFVQRAGKVRFETNPTTASGEGVRISSSLLRVAKIVE